MSSTGPARSKEWCCAAILETGYRPVQAGANADEFRRDLANGIEAYLQMWERALGVVGDSCRADVADVTKNDLKLVKKGMTPEQVVTVLGQPHVRKGKAFSYCGKGGPVDVRFSTAGRVR